MTLDTDDQPISEPAESLRVIRAQQAAATRIRQLDPCFSYWPWGVAWLIGFGLNFLRFGPGGRIFVDLPDRTR